MTAATALRLFDPESGAPGGRRRFRMMLLMRIERWDVRRDGPLTEAALQQKIEALGYEVTPRLLSAGAVAVGQTDLRERLLAVARGLVKVTLDGESAILGAGDIAFVPRGSVRRAEAIGAAPAFCFEAAYPTTAA
jgi:mannose-6-phosphate isomerase-like protein (cupin superfamily)